MMENLPESLAGMVERRVEKHGQTLPVLDLEPTTQDNTHVT